MKSLMISNREIRRLFSLYSELLLLHRKDERLAVLLSGAAYRLRNISEPVTSLNKSELLKSFAPGSPHLLTSYPAWISGKFQKGH